MDKKEGTNPKAAGRQTLRKDPFNVFSTLPVVTYIII
jgi:hypothetical protein